MIKTEASLFYSKDTTSRTTSGEMKELYQINQFHDCLLYTSDAADE